MTTLAHNRALGAQEGPRMARLWLLTVLVLPAYGCGGFRFVKMYEDTSTPTEMTALIRPPLPSERMKSRWAAIYISSVRNLNTGQTEDANMVRVMPGIYAIEVVCGAYQVTLTVQQQISVDAGYSYYPDCVGNVPAKATVTIHKLLGTAIPPEFGINASSDPAPDPE